MTIDYYYNPGSPPGAQVVLTAAQIGVKLNKKPINLFAGENLKQEFLKINPQHCVPTIVEEDGFSLWESRSIMAYLVSKYAPESGLYPTDDLKKRARIDTALQFDLGSLYTSFGNLYYTILLDGGSYCEKKAQVLRTKLEILDNQLGQHHYVAGDELSIADFCTLVTVNTIQAVKFDISTYKNITSWFARLQPEVKGWQEGIVEARAAMEKWAEGKV